MSDRGAPATWRGIRNGVRAVGHEAAYLESGDFDFSLSNQQERGDCSAVPSRLKARTQVSQHATPLLPACGHHCQHPLDEPAPLFVVGAPADPTPDHRVPLGGAPPHCFQAVRPRPTRTSTDSLPPARSRATSRSSSCSGGRRSLSQSRLDLTPQSGHRRAESSAVHLLVLESMPPSEQPVRQPQQPPTKGGIAPVPAIMRPLRSFSSL